MILIPDFNNDVTVGIPAVDIERVCVLQRRFEFIDAFEFYKKNKFGGVNNGINLVRARLISFFLQMEGMLKRRFKPGEFLELRRVCFEAKEEDELVRAFFVLSEDLDHMNLTKIDTRKHFDMGVAEIENRESGL